jgi:hypothetical protein
MLPYWILFATFVIGAFVYEPRAKAQLAGPHGRPVQRRHEVSPFFWIAGLYVALMVGLRYRVGVDWTNYVRIYRDELPWQDLGAVLNRGDPLFYLPMWWFTNGGIEIWGFFLLSACVFTIGLFTFARRQPNPWLAILVAVPFLIIVIAMSGVRQATAIGFVFLALVGFSRKSPVRFIFWTICAAACHASAIILLPVAGLSFTRNRFQAAVLLVIMAAVGAFVLRASFQSYAEDYLTHELDSSGAIYRIIMSLIPGIIFLMFGKRFELEPHERLLWRNFSLLAVASLALLPVIPSSTVIDRLLLYVYPLQMFVLSGAPYILAKRPSERSFIIIGIVIYLAAVLFVFLTFAVNREPYIPYQFWPLADRSNDAF